MSPSNMLGQMKQKQHTRTHTHKHAYKCACLWKTKIIGVISFTVLSIPQKGAGPEGLVVKELITYYLLHCGSGHERVNHILSPSLYFQ